MWKYGSQVVRKRCVLLFTTAKRYDQSCNKIRSNDKKSNFEPDFCAMCQVDFVQRCARTFHKAE